MRFLRYAIILILAANSHVALAEPASAPVSPVAPLTKQEAQALAEKTFLKENTGIKKYKITDVTDVIADAANPNPNVLSFHFQGVEEYMLPGFHAMVHVNILTREVRVIRGQ